MVDATKRSTLHGAQDDEFLFHALLANSKKMDIPYSCIQINFAIMKAIFAYYKRTIMKLERKKIQMLSIDSFSTLFIRENQNRNFKALT